MTCKLLAVPFFGEVRCASEKKVKETRDFNALCGGYVSWTSLPEFSDVGVDLISQQQLVLDFTSIFACMKCDELIVTYQNSKRRGYFGLCYRLLSKVDSFVKQFITFQAPCEHHLLFVQRLKMKLWGEFVMLQRWTQIIVYLTKITFLFRRNK